MEAHDSLAVALDRIRVLLETAGVESPPFPPTLLYNEGWLLRLVLDWFYKNRVEGRCLAFGPGARWYSEALLPSAFLARRRGDPLAEGWTNADGVIGQFAIGSKRKRDLVVRADATQFVVVEAKMSSPLSSGVTRARYFDQAARTVACMAETMRRAGRQPGEMERLAFCVLAPEAQIRAGVFARQMNPASILTKVERRVRGYEGAKDGWFEEWFRPAWERITMNTLGWEEVVAKIEEQDARAGRAIGRFYDLCREFN